MIVPKLYIKVEITVPIIVAIGIVLLGFFILLAGIVADSIPKKAYNVITQTIGKTSKSLLPVILNSGKTFQSNKNIPEIIINSRGIILATVVKI